MIGISGAPRDMAMDMIYSKTGLEAFVFYSVSRPGTQLIALILDQSGMKIVHIFLEALFLISYYQSCGSFFVFNLT